MRNWIPGPCTSGSRHVIALFVLTSLASALVVSIRVPWLRVAIRVCGSWVAAIGLLMLGWTLRG